MSHTVSVIGRMFHAGKCASAIIAGSTTVRAISGPSILARSAIRLDGTVARIYGRIIVTTGPSSAPARNHPAARGENRSLKNVMPGNQFEIQSGAGQETPIFGVGIRNYSS